MGSSAEIRFGADWGKGWGRFRGRSAMGSGRFRRGSAMLSGRFRGGSAPNAFFKAWKTHLRAASSSAGVPVSGNPQAPILQGSTTARFDG